MNSYQKNIIVLLLLAPVTMLVYYFVVYTFYTTPDNQSFWVYSCYKKKNAYARSISTPKLVFTSGSATLFGVSAKDIENVEKIPTVNYAIFAGLGPKYILYTVKNILNPGDTVILTFEMELYLDEGGFNDGLEDYILTCDKTYFKTLDINDRINIIFNVNVKKFTSQLIRKMTFDGQEADDGFTLTSKTLNKNGDETNNVNCKSAGRMKLYPTKDELSALEGVKSVVEFSKWCSEHRVDVYISFANRCYSPEFDTQKYLIFNNKLIEYFLGLNIKVIGTPSDFFMNPEWFCDSPNHLNSKGVEVRTKKLIEMMQSAGVFDKFH